MKKEKIQQISEAAKAHGQAILDRWLPGGKTSGQEYVVKNPHRDDNRAGSLSINVPTGKGKDFASGDAFGDYVAVVAFAIKSDMSTAADELARFIGLSQIAESTPFQNQGPITTGWHAILPVPDDAPDHPVAHPKRGRPSNEYRYVDSNGALLGLIWRFDAAPPKYPKKEFAQLSFQTNGSESEWRFKSMPSPRPLYGLDRLAANPTKPVLIHEGEKAAEAGRVLSAKHISMSWPGGASAVAQADFKALNGRTVILWPDNDQPGVEAMQKAGKAVLKAGATSCHVLNLELLAKYCAGPNDALIDRLGDFPQGFDCADAIAEGWCSAHFQNFLELDGVLLAVDGSDVVEPTESKNDEPRDIGPFILDESGLSYVETEKDGKVRVTRICSPLTVPALARDQEGGNWSPVLKFKDRDGTERQEILSYKFFVGDGTDGVKQLADLGLEIESGRRPVDLLKTYVIKQQPTRRARLVDQTGWHGAGFLFAEGAVGDTDETLLYRGSRRAIGVFTKRGSLEDWKNSIGRVAEGNPRLMFCIAVAFAGPLLKPCGLQSMAFHLVGDSSIGKSGALVAAGSVWGSVDSQVHSWRQTSNALEYTAAQHNDALLIMDELKEVDPKEAGSIAYMLGNSKGKGRAHHSGGLRDSTTWSIAMLSSGELGLGDHLASAGQKRYAGQEVRFIELSADAGLGHGMWSELHGMAGGGDLTDYLKKAARRYFGTAGRSFVGLLVKRRSELAQRWTRHNHDFFKYNTPANAGGQVMRVMSSFSIVGFAGELAAEWGVLPWAAGASTQAAAWMFSEWLKDRPGIGNSEEHQIISHVRNVLERTWQAKFVDWKRVDEEKADLSRMAAVHESLGFRKREPESSNVDPSFLFYVTRARFHDEFAAKGGFKAKRVAAVLKQHGVLKSDQDSNTLRETLPNGDPRSYCIQGSKLWSINI